MQAGYPLFLDFEGPKIEGLDAPSLPDDFDNLNEVEQGRAKITAISTIFFQSIRNPVASKEQEGL